MSRRASAALALLAALPGLALPIPGAGADATPPLLGVEGETSGAEGAPLEFVVRASDPDGQPLTLAAFVLPPGARFTDHRDGTGTFRWTPGHDQAGDHPLTVSASDGGLVTREELTLRVADVNRAPVPQPVAPQRVRERATLEVLLSGSDPDGDPVQLVPRSLPPGAAFDASRNLLSWTPGWTQAGSWNADLDLTDGELATLLRVPIVVEDNDRAPELPDPAPRALKAARDLYVRLRGSDPDGDPLTYSLVSVPEGVTLTKDVVRWTPTPGQVGVHDIRVRVSDGTLADDAILTVTVEENLGPVVDVRGPARIDVHARAVFDATAYDPDGHGIARFAWDLEAADGLQEDYAGPAAGTNFRAPGEHVVTATAYDHDGIPGARPFRVLVDDEYFLTLRVLGDAHFLGDRRVEVHLKDWNGAPVAGESIEVETAWSPNGAADVPMHRFRMTTDAQGRAVAPLPHDPVLLSLPGGHRLTAGASIEDSYLGDVEAPSASARYGETILP